VAGDAGAALGRDASIPGRLARGTARAVAGGCEGVAAVFADGDMDGRCRAGACGAARGVAVVDDSAPAVEAGLVVSLGVVPVAGVEELGSLAMTLPQCQSTSKTAEFATADRLPRPNDNDTAQMQGS